MVGTLVVDLNDRLLSPSIPAIFVGLGAFRLCIDLTLCNRYPGVASVDSHGVWMHVPMQSLNFSRGIKVELLSARLQQRE